MQLVGMWREAAYKWVAGSATPSPYLLEWVGEGKEHTRPVNGEGVCGKGENEMQEQHRYDKCWGLGGLAQERKLLGPCLTKPTSCGIADRPHTW